ncbi:MAG: PAS domain S-box protein, partial [Candidatus Mariimomonas ferrooxydans]
VEALSLAKESPPDIIISDVLMPEMDGFRLCQKVKQDKRLRKIPFIFYSGSYTDPEDEELGTAVGASRYILKPTETDTFLHIIDEVIEEHKNKKLHVPRMPIEEEEVVYKMYNEALVKKLDSKMHEVEEVLSTLSETEGKYRLLFEHANDAIYLIDPDTTKILDCNKKASEMDVYSIDELKKMKIIDLHPENEHLIVLEKLKAVSRKGSALGISGIHHIDKNGKQVPIEINSAMVEIKGKMLNLSIVRDITERKKAEKELKNRMEELEKFYKVAIDRELKMKQLKDELEKLKLQPPDHKKSEGDK